MDYQPISDPAQLQMLQELLRMVLYAILLSAGVASVCLFGLCLSELRLPRRRPSVAKGRVWRTSADALPELERGEDRVPADDADGGRRHERVADARGGSFVIPHSPPAGGLALRSDIR